MRCFYQPLPLLQFSKMKYVSRQENLQTDTRAAERTDKRTGICHDSCHTGSQTDGRTYRQTSLKLPVTFRVQTALESEGHSSVLLPSFFLTGTTSQLISEANQVSSLCYKTMTHSVLCLQGEVPKASALRGRLG